MKWLLIIALVLYAGLCFWHIKTYKPPPEGGSIYPPHPSWLWYYADTFYYFIRVPAYGVGWLYVEKYGKNDPEAKVIIEILEGGKNDNNGN